MPFSCFLTKALQFNIRNIRQLSERSCSCLWGISGSFSVKLTWEISCKKRSSPRDRSSRSVATFHSLFIVHHEYVWFLLCPNTCWMCVCLGFVLFGVWSEDEVFRDEVIMTDCWETERVSLLGSTAVWCADKKWKIEEDSHQWSAQHGISTADYTQDQRAFVQEVIRSYTHDSLRYEASIIHATSSLLSRNVQDTLLLLCWNLGHKYSSLWIIILCGQCDMNPWWRNEMLTVLKAWEAQMQTALRLIVRSVAETKRPTFGCKLFVH